MIINVFLMKVQQICPHMSYCGPGLNWQHYRAQDIKDIYGTCLKINVVYTQLCLTLKDI